MSENLLDLMALKILQRRGGEEEEQQKQPASERKDNIDDKVVAGRCRHFHPQKEIKNAKDDERADKTDKLDTQFAGNKIYSQGFFR